MPEKHQHQNILDKVDKNRRGFLKSVLSTSFAVPLIASFSVATLMTSTANALTVANFDNQPYMDFFFRESGR